MKRRNSCVGESGSGKTTVAEYHGALPENTAVSGEILYRDHVISSLPESEMDRFRWKDIAIVFQNSLEVMNPVLKVGFQVMEPMIRHLGISPERARSKCADLFRTVGLDPE